MGVIFIVELAEISLNQYEGVYQSVYQMEVGELNGSIYGMKNSQSLVIYVVWRGMLRKSAKFTQNGVEDIMKPYGIWFQHDLMGPDYRKPNGRRFGLPSSPWFMTVPEDVEMVKEDEEKVVEWAAFGSRHRADVEGLVMPLQLPNFAVGL